MTRRRIITIVAGICGLIVLSYYRLVIVPQNALQQQQILKDAAASELLLKQDGTVVLVSEEQEGLVMGTTFNIRYLRPSNLEKVALELSIFSELDAVDQRMSTYKKQSELSRFNRAPVGEKFKLSPELLTVLELSRELGTKTKGAFDISIGPLINLWGFGPEKFKEEPSSAQLKQARAAVGPDKWSLYKDQAQAERHHPKLYLDLSAIAKGYGADEAALKLESLGVDNYMVEVGGEIRVHGHKLNKERQEKPWTLGIEAPVKEGRKLYGLLSLEQGALATSGDYRNYREVSDSLVSHTFDPRMGGPTPSRTASVSVVRDTAIEADALATALSVLSPTEALDMANQYDWALLLLERTESGLKDFRSNAFEKLNYRQIAPRLNSTP